MRNRWVPPAAASPTPISSPTCAWTSSFHSSGFSHRRPKKNYSMDQFVAEFQIFPFNFAPKVWAFCDGNTLPLSQNTALFSLLAASYEGDGNSNFALRNIRANQPMH